MNTIVITNNAIFGILKFDKPIRFRYTISIGEPQQPKKKHESHKTTANNPPPAAAFKAFLLFSLYFKNANAINANDRAYEMLRKYSWSLIYF